MKRTILRLSCALTAALLLSSCVIVPGRWHDHDRWHDRDFAEHHWRG